MKTALTNSALRLASPLKLAGPLFDKELRVSSRRRRNYVLRSAFILLLSAFVATVWLGVVESEYSAVFQKSRMAVAGKTIISTIVWFQFITTQLIAVIMLSTSISDEIQHRTLGLLMTTPISSFHIVMGKLFSKLLQIILLLAISLPLLAVVRVFGGVPGNYLLSSLCITLTAVILAGSLSLLFSISNRRAYVVIIKAVVTLAFFFAFVPTIGVTLLGPRWMLASGPPNMAHPLVAAFLHLNPFGAMSINTTMMISPIIPVAMPRFYWPLHCVLMLAASSLLIAWSVYVVRKVALRQATGQLDLLPRRRVRSKQKRKSAQSSSTAPMPQEQAGIVRRVSGSPVLWKEIRAPTIRGVDGRNSMIGLVTTIIALLLTYAVCEKEDCLDENFTHVWYMVMFVFIGSIFTMVLASSCISSEKESRAWPVMLATSMDDWHILLGKAGGVFRRCLPIWLLLGGHIIFFVCMRYVHLIAIVHSSILVAGLATLLTGVGIYFSARFKRTTSAVVASFGVAAALWVIIPTMAGLISQFTRDLDHRDAFETYLSANPVIQVGVLMEGAGGAYNARTKLYRLHYDWPRRHSDWNRIWGTTGALIVCMLINVSVGFLFAWRAKCRFRRNVF